MITFLTICYAAVLFLLIKLKVVKPSPIAYSTIGLWMLLLLILLIIPMQFFAPSGPLRVFSYVNQIVPNVSGQVIEVPIDPNQPLREGDVLFRIDPRPYQFAVDRLEASLADAGVGVSQLFENLRAAEATTAMARANVFATETDLDRRAREQVEAAEAQVDGTQATLEATQAQVVGTEASLKIARADLSRMTQAAASEAVSRQQLDAARRQVETLDAQLDAAVAQVEGMRASLEGAKSQARNAELGVESGSDRIQQAREQHQQALANERSARLAYEAEIGGLNPVMKQVAADLDSAKLNLEWTTVRAPADGFVANLQLRPGFRVASLAMSPVMSFVETETTIVGALIGQSQLRHVEEGQEAEVILELYPGRTFQAKVMYVVQAQGQGQMSPSGQLPVLDPTEANAPYFVRLELQDFPEGLDLPVGAGGSVAIYTSYGAATHMVRMVMVRMDTWLNYLF